MMRKIAVGLAVGLAFIVAPFASANLPKYKSYHTKKYAHKHFKGLYHTPESKTHMQLMRHMSFADGSKPIPQMVDLSPSVSLPEDQGQCGACWDFSLTKALRSEYMLAKKPLPSLEFNYLLNNCGAGPRMAGCNGGSFAAAVSFENGAGPGFNSENPYNAVKGKCKHLPVQATTTSFAMLGVGRQPPTFKDLAYAVGVEKHVLSIDVAAGSGEWESYSDGIYNECVGGGKGVDHMINMVGYDCETSIDSSKNCVFDSNGKPIHGDGYLIVMNNWGESWGTQAANHHGGYMKTRMYAADGSHCNAIATDALFFQINK